MDQPKMANCENHMLVRKDAELQNSSFMLLFIPQANLITYLIMSGSYLKKTVFSWEW